MNSKIKNIKAASGMSPAQAEGVRQALPITCTVTYWEGKWIFDVPGEGTVAVRDCKQARVLVALLMNVGMLMEPDDIEEAAATGPVVVHGCRPAEGESEPGREVDNGPAPQSDDEDPPRTDHGVGDDGNEEACGITLPLKAKFTSGADPDLLMLYGVKQSRHTGDAGDYRMIRELDRRLVELDGGIAAAKARGSGKLACALEEERASARKHRDWYRNAITGLVRPFYSKEVEDKAKRCRMWIVRGLQALGAKGLPQAATSLNKASSRGMQCSYVEQPEYRWIVIPPQCGPLPVLRTSDYGHESASEVAA